MEINCEYSLQVLINKDLREMKVGYWHRDKGAHHKSRSRNKWKFDYKDKKEPEKAWPDLLIQPGNERLFYVEVKDINKKETSDQIAFKEWAISMKYHYYCVHTWEEWELVKKIELT